MAIVAADLLSTSLTTAVISMSGKTVERETVSLENLEGETVSLLLQNQIKKYISAFENKPQQIKSVGIAVPGIYYSKTGCVWAPNIPGWENYPLRQDMNKLSEQYI